MLLNLLLIIFLDNHQTDGNFVVVSADTVEQILCKTFLFIVKRKDSLPEFIINYYLHFALL